MAGDLPFDPESETFDARFLRRLGPLGLPFVLNNIANDAARQEENKYAGHYFDPRPDAPIEDQRGMSLPQLNLQAKYLRSEGAYPAPPLDPLSARTPAWSSGLARDLGGMYLDRQIQEQQAKKRAPIS